MTTGVLAVSGTGSVCEIVVRDDDLRVVGSGRAELEIELDAGIYRVEVWVPGTTDVSLVAVRGRTVARHARTDLVPDSVVPLAGIGSANATHAALAAEVAAGSDGATADAGRLLLVARSGGAPRFVPPRVAVLDLRGEVVATTGSACRVDARHGCAGMGLDLAPGYYVMRHDVPGRGARGQVVRVLAGHETQVFAPWAEDHVDLAAAVVCMPPLGTGFDAADTTRYLRAEQAVRSLSTGRALPGPGDDPLLAMVDTVVGGRADTGDVRWADVDVLAAVDPHGEPAAAGPPVLAAALPRLAARFSDVKYPENWPAGLLTAPTVGSVWARWDLDEAPLPAGARPLPVPRRPVDEEPAASVQPARPRLAVLGASSATLAAAPTVVVDFASGRHVDVGLWRDDDPEGAPPRSEVRVRLGARARIYRTAGAAVRYGDTPLPDSPTDAVPMAVEADEVLVEHLAGHVRWEAG